MAENVADLVLSHRGEVRGQVETAVLQEQIDAYMGHVFERIAEQTYYRRRPGDGLPLV